MRYLISYKFNKIVLFCFLFIYNSCNGVLEEKVVGNYFLVAVDYEKDGTSLNFQYDDNSYSIIKEKVFAVGHNNDFIIAQQHPRVFPNEPDKTITNYFIVKVYKENTYWAEKGVIGPLTKKEFDKRRKELKIEDIKFDVELE